LNIISGEKRGILVDVSGTRCGPAKGGAPMNSVIKEYPTPVKASDEENVTILIKNMGDGVKIAKRERCVKCIDLDEFHYKGADDCKNPNNEYVKLRNKCDTACDLTGWTIKDRKGHGYVLPSHQLDAGSAVAIYSGCGTDNLDELYWCYDAGGLCDAVWNNDGDTLYLRDSGGFLCLEYTYP
jgi:hypothetical protein